MQKILNRFDPRIAIKTGIAASTSYFVAAEYAHFFSRPDSMISGIWCVVTTIVVMQANIGGTYKAAAMRLLGVIIGSALGALSTQYLGVTILNLGLTVAASIFICSLFQLKESYRIASLSVAIVMLSWAAHPDFNPWTVSFFRSFDSIVGIFIAIAISHLVWPEQTWINIKNQYLKALQMAKICCHDALKITDSQNSDHEIAELFGLLANLHSELDDTKLDFFSFDQERDIWVQATESLDRLAESVAVLSEIPKTNLKNIFDESLRAHVEKFTEELQDAFEELQSHCIDAVSVDCREKIKLEDMALSKDLERFRGTHLTRNFSLTDVENFYSFFYQLHYIAQQLQLIEEQLLSRET